MDDDFDFFNRFVKLLTCSVGNADLLHLFLVVFGSKIMFLFFIVTVTITVYVSQCCFIYYIFLALGRTRKFIPPPWYEGVRVGWLDGTPPLSFLNVAVFRNEFSFKAFERPRVNIHFFIYWLHVIY